MSSTVPPTMANNWASSLPIAEVVMLVEYSVAVAGNSNGVFSSGL
jgi:hypothetical protein